MEIADLVEGKKVVSIGGNYKSAVGKIMTTVPVKGKVMVSTKGFGVVPIKVKHLRGISDNWIIKLGD